MTASLPFKGTLGNPAKSADRVSLTSSESESSGKNLAEGFVQWPQPKSRGLEVIVPPVLKGSRPTRTSSAFQRWKGRQRVPVPRLLIVSIIGSVAVMFVASNLTSMTWLTLIPDVLTSLLIYYIIHLRSLLPPRHIEKIIVSWGLSEYLTQSFATTPQDFSLDIIPIPCHSHNDYWRHVPLYDALAAGCTSVEADVWLSGNDLFVGHSKRSLTKEGTLELLYINPLISILSKQNTPSQITATNHTSPNSTSPSKITLNGIFDVDFEIPLVLLIDVETEGSLTFSAVLEHLEPLRSRGWLTYFDGTAIVQGLITVVGTGNTPFDLLVANTTYRDIFFDAPLEELWGDDYQDILAGEKYTAENSYYASVSFQEEIGNLWHGILTPEQVLKIRGLV